MSLLIFIARVDVNLGFFFFFFLIDRTNRLFHFRREINAVIADAL